MAGGGEAVALPQASMKLFDPSPETGKAPPGGAPDDP